VTPTRRTEGLLGAGKAWPDCRTARVPSAGSRVMLHFDLLQDSHMTAPRSCVFEERVQKSTDLLQAGNDAFAKGDAAAALEAFLQGLWQVSRRRRGVSAQGGMVMLLPWCLAGVGCHAGPYSTTPLDGLTLHLSGLLVRLPLPEGLQSSILPGRCPPPPHTHTHARMHRLPAQVDFDEASYNFELLDKHRTVVDQAQVKLLLNTSTLLLKTASASTFNPKLVSVCSKRRRLCRRRRRRHCRRRCLHHGHSAAAAIAARSG
jgi:hypothetical protein